MSVQREPYVVCHRAPRSWFCTPASLDVLLIRAKALLKSASCDIFKRGARPGRAVSVPRVPEKVCRDRVGGYAYIPIPARSCTVPIAAAEGAGGSYLLYSELDVLLVPANVLLMSAMADRFGKFFRRRTQRPKRAEDITANGVACALKCPVSQAVFTDGSIGSG
jgi:hypothetical protein